ncbi:MAG: hypothetical protein CBC01_00555 [Betaproteobacteria bacterium TMED41]|nr:MAG: hypothetical protein CBC01_00555 [Betaproteobacteria bacterium TMED41]
MSKILVKHNTLYKYEEPVRYAVQRIFLSPRIETQRRIIKWVINSNADLFKQEDSLGNMMHVLVVSKPTKTITIDIFGEVELTKFKKIRSNLLRKKTGKIFKDSFGIPLDYFKCQTDLTTPNDEIVSLAHATCRSITIKNLIQLARAIEEKVIYTKGATTVATSATEAWEKKAGVCQDHAHVMLSACRSLGLPARYVSGYLRGQARASEATHAWVEVWLNKWLGIDVTHFKLIDDQFLSLAVGLDYEHASPVRGFRQGGGVETMEVKVSVTD